MLEHLISDDLDPVISGVPPTGFTPLGKADPAALIDAQAETSQWLEEMGLTQKDVQDQASTTAARAAFTAITTGTTPGNVQNALISMKFSDAAASKVKELVDEEGNPDLMLRVAYRDWETDRKSVV